MTETQIRLMPYVQARFDCIVAYKEENNIRPLIVTEPEIVEDIRKDVLECMRELYRTGHCDGCNTLNYPALKKIEK